MISSKFSGPAIALTRANNFDFERESCLFFPVMTDLDQQVSGVHYSVEIDKYVGCDTDMSGNPTYENCHSFTQATFNYRYQELTTIDYFTPDGKLVTTKIEKRSIGLNDSSSAETRGNWDYANLDYNYFPKDEEARKQLQALFAESKLSLEKEIAKILYESSNPACKDSVYR